MTDRRARILHLVTEGYIDTAHPVPSAVIAERLNLSSATVRNEFGALEEEGFLHQPHTSAGRVPTSQGFGTYALGFIPPKRLSARERSRLRRRIDTVRGDNLLKRIATATAELTGYAVVVSLPGEGSMNTLEIHLSLLSSHRLLAVVVLENGLVRQLPVDLDPAPTEDVIDDAERNLRQLTIPMNEVAAALAALSTQTEGELARTLRALAEAWPSLTPPRVISDGLKQLLTEPESNDPAFVRLVVELVDRPGNPTPPDSSPLTVLLDESVARIAARLDFGSAVGALSVVGPARMRYRQALMVANAVSEAVAAEF